ncbi:MAG: UDP-N-acetylglucosamine 4,6-dehydratase (inverting) [Candidatus Competibacteraceae bacterium]|nr:UDP-N-acetylglucosamine 4,6-dehydratase (inverting) [Candidatus Competibacteraceae bacterium]MCP5125064.1 UDP-N-acetylglucosamine 4,6-dehydratase (inverting) [Gammaproteobacteria bacterium]
MNLTNKTLLITGGTGSFGRKFTELVLREHEPRRIIVFSRDELKQHEMSRLIPDKRLSFFLGDVRDRDRLTRAFEAKVDIVVHAAALKQVPACEYNPFEAIKTNVLGAQNIIDAAIDCGVAKVIALSTDKAVNPVNLYGATKLCAEKLFVHGNAYTGDRPTCFSCVRYGNVVGSRGSVVPVFLSQRTNGVVTITDPRMTRFWLTLEQGVRFVIQAIGLMRGGEVFVPRIPSMGILDLVKAVAPDCQVQETGIRPGEKLHESLISVDEARHAIALEDLFVIHPEHSWWCCEKSLQGQSLPDGFAYASDSNDQWLSVDELRGIVEATY